MLTQLHGKVFTMALDGKSRKIGKITQAEIDKSRTRLELSIELTDDEIAGILGAAADRAEAAASPIGLSESEIQEAVGDIINPLFTRSLLPYTDAQIEEILEQAEDQL